jgi:uncharacterized iron-regulated protein
LSLEQPSKARPRSACTSRLLALCILCFGFSVRAASADELNWSTWASAVERQHVLAGAVYNAASGAITRFGRGDLGLGSGNSLVLLGEVHDNPDHHRLQAWIIENSIKADTQHRPAMVFEHIRTNQQPALDQFKTLRETGGAATSSDLFRLLDWDKSGWPAQAMFAPLFDAVIRAGLAIYPASPPREKVRAVGRGEPSSLSLDDRARLKLDEPLPPPLADALVTELKEGHCGALPDTAIPAMSAAQRYRDAAFADVLLAAADQHGSAILIAGNGHVRSDRGVPWYVRKRAPDKKVVAIVLAEVEPEKTDPASYVPRDANGEPAADLVIFTPRAERSDPCAQLHQQVKQRQPGR